MVGEFDGSRVPSADAEEVEDSVPPAFGSPDADFRGSGSRVQAPSPRIIPLNKTAGIRSRPVKTRMRLGLQQLRKAPELGRLWSER